MTGHRRKSDARAIEAIIRRQFHALDWAEGRSANWPAFTSDFFTDASLYPAARPAKRQAVATFVERMKGLAQTSLRSFSERLLGTEIRIFGNVAVAFGACEITENETRVTQGVEAFLLIKDEGAWRIVSQAWDTASDDNPVPSNLLLQGKRRKAASITG